MSETLPQRPFDTDNFSINLLSTSPDGFDLQAGKALGKTDGDLPPVVLTDDERARLKDSVQGEMGFQKAHVVRNARSEWREALQENGDTPETAALEEKFLKERRDYQSRGKKVGLRALRLVDTNTLEADAKVVHFTTYGLAAANARPEMHEYANTSTVSMAVLTADKRLIVQHRAIAKARITEPGFVQGNGLYADIPGASAAGHLDASFKSEERKPGTADPVDKAFIFGAISKEAEEELGLEEHHIQNMRIAGIATNKVKPHDEFLLLAETNLTASEVKQVSRDSTRNKNLGDADFDERFIDIEGTPEAIQTLLTQVRCPIPPTHVAGLVAAGYSIALGKYGQERADAWKTELEMQVTENYRAIDATVAQYYHDHPEALKAVPERYWGKKFVPERSITAYNPAYGPEEQGLPSFEDEMVRTGLMPETRHQVETAYLLDVDGVITDPIEKRVTNIGIVDTLAQKLNDGVPVGLNSGRSTQWMAENVLPLLQERITDPAVLQNLIIIGEKGGTWNTFSSDGTMHHGISPKLAKPEAIAEATQELVNSVYGDSMFVDSKDTMISVEMRDGHNLSDFQEKQKALLHDVSTLVAQAGSEWKIDATTIATDIQSVHSSKALGADRFLEFLKHRDIKVAGAIEAFGDSQSDLEMSDELVRRGYTTTFHNVGNSPIVTAKPYSIRNHGDYTDGTLRALSEEQ